MKRPRWTLVAVSSVIVLAGCRAPVDSDLRFKLLITETGWTAVEQPALIEAGLSPEVDPRRLALSVRGLPVAIRVTGSADGRFDAADHLEFYGVAEDTALTGTGVYWLSIVAEEDADQASRITTSVDAPEQTAPEDVYLATTTRRYRSLFTPSIQNGAAENFFGPIVSDLGVLTPLEVTHSRIDTELAPHLSLILQGVTLGEHRVSVALNGVALGDVTFLDQASQPVTLPIPNGVVVDGEATVDLRRAGGNAADIVLVDTVSLSYPRGLIAIENQLEFDAASSSTVQVAGFAAPAVRAFDVSNTLQPLELPIQTDGTTVQLNAGEGQRILVVADGTGRAVSGIVPVRAAEWHKEGARFLIVTPAAFHGQLEPLAQLRRSEGLSVSVVDLEEIYDRYSFGVKDERALRAFLDEARRHMLEPPEYVLLVGDASDDPRNRLGEGDFDLLPVHSISTRYLETSSDDWFVDFDEDAVPDLAIGRLPARTAGELDVMLAKILMHHPKPVESLLQGVFVNDEPTGFAFETTSQTMATSVAPRMSASQVVRGGGESGLLPPMLDALRSGVQLLVYFGHGSTQQWAGDALTNDTVAALPAAGELPIFLNMTCLNGYFQDALSESLGEALVKAPGRGALAAWVSSGLTEPDEQAPMIDSALRNLLNQRLPLGEALRRAKAETWELDARRTWVLLGDPTLRLWDVPY